MYFFVIIVCALTALLTLRNVAMLEGVVHGLGKVVCYFGLILFMVNTLIKVILNRLNIRAA
ncbi:phosphohydrolase [Paraglaciecola sp. L1A13]|uniref:phosphohydrolase n=1 Tax=Paraglaciecola sp. L1A13 TaxID=2686359 RepID=UPI00131DEAE1|nr:phosphohydrolase [Paraglaciecola sp. L1A13]